MADGSNGNNEKVTRAEIFGEGTVNQQQTETRFREQVHAASPADRFAAFQGAPNTAEQHINTGFQLTGAQPNGLGLEGVQPGQPRMLPPERSGNLWHQSGGGRGDGLGLEGQTTQQQQQPPHARTESHSSQEPPARVVREIQSNPMTGPVIQDSRGRYHYPNDRDYEQWQHHDANGYPSKEQPQRNADGTTAITPERVAADFQRGLQAGNIGLAQADLMAAVHNFHDPNQFKQFIEQINQKLGGGNQLQLEQVSLPPQALEAAKQNPAAAAMLEGTSMFKIHTMVGGHEVGQPLQLSIQSEQALRNFQRRLQNPDDNQ